VIGASVVAVLTIRAAEAADLEGLRDVFRRASLSNAGDRAALLAHPEVLVWPGDALAAGGTTVAVQDGTVVGFATVLPAGDGVELDDLFVAPERMRQGVARRLIGAVRHAAEAAGAGYVEVTGNQHAMAFYTSVGFRPVGEAQTRFGPALRLRLDLGQATARAIVTERLGWPPPA
jgi:GNAT superfamily N-acetyltransferase